ncbi:leucine-rich repeat-containing protein 7 isoform A [Alligator mississippiensis]|uniref:Leucine-rich repeat-containing protein 7 isoform A n=1 Tax=Alligator mississippiensis TaxID=8496 RepID=A0A151NJA1_ALLMI|nr:leucine-rich repeat-containing protein 7 isoform A [Alligator mississippiensis]
MTTKRKIIGRLVPCRCFRGEEETISVLDYSHCGLQQVPKEVFNFERTLEELYLDANQIEELPKQLFNCQALRKLSIPDNDLSSLPTTIASLVNLRELDISKNGVQDFPENIKCCKCLTIIEASVNPVSKLPDGFTQLLNLTQLYLNDAFLEFLPANFGRLVKLRILELRENHLKTLPKSMHKLMQLERLDLGNNEFSELPEVLDQIQNLRELWMDSNSLQIMPGSIGKLKQLVYLDMSKNRIESIDLDVSGCEALEDLLLSSNMLQQLPDSIGLLKRLTTLKVDDNQLTILPNAIGNLSLLEEFDCSCNELESLPSTIGYLHSLRTLAVDENFLTELPREIGSCKNVTVMSLRSNKLEFLPDEIGQMQKLRVLNLSDNRLKNLPFTFTKLKELAALWLSDNQSKALIPLQTEAHPETKQRVLTNYMFPQQPRGDEDFQSDSDSFNPTLWEEQRQQRMTVAFEFEEKKEEEDNAGKVKVEINLKRYPTPYPEDLKNMVKSVQNMVGKTSHGVRPENSTPTTNPEQSMKEKYEHKWPMAPKEISVEDSFGHPNDMRIGELRPSIAETPLYQPKLVLLGKEKKESTDESEADKIHCLNNSVSSGTYSDYSPSQASSGSSNARVKMGSLQSTAKETVNNALWSNRLAQSFPQPLETKPLLSQRESAPAGNLQQRNDRRPMKPSKSIISISKSTERLSPMMRELKTNKFKKSQSIDEIDIGAYKVYNIPLENYASSNDATGMHERPDKMIGQEHCMSSMSRSQSVPMLDDELLNYGSVKVQQQQKPSVTKKVYQFDQSFNPQGAVEVKAEKRLPPPFQHNPEYVPQQSKNITQDLISPRAYRGYPPMEHMFSFSQPSVNEEVVNAQFSSQGSRSGFLRRADSLASSTEMSMFRRVSEPHELPQSDRYSRPQYRGAMERQSSISVSESQFLKRNGRYEDEHPSYQEVKAQSGSFPVKNLTQRRPLSARSYSTESYGTSQTRPVSARPTMAALLEKIPSDYNLGNYGDKPSDNSDIKTRPTPVKGNESCAKMPADWRQQLLRHIEARRLDRTPSQQSNILDNGQEDISASSQWNPYPLGRRDVPPETITKKLPEFLA